MRAPLILALALALSGCAGLAESIRDMHESRCRSYGLTPGTDAFALCYQRESNRYWDRVNREIPR